MKLHDIDKRLTEKVVGYIAQGYTIHSPSMSGHQGEINKVDLVKGTELIRVWLETSHNWNDRDGFYGDKILLKIGRWNKKVNTKSRNMYRDETIWFSDITIIEETTFYQVSTRTNWFTESKDEAIHCARISLGRNRSSDWYYGPHHVALRGDKYKQIAAKYLRRVAGYQRISLDDIVVSKNVKDRSYRIEYHGRSYRLGGTKVETY